jgi:hypothetical protein
MAGFGVGNWVRLVFCPREVEPTEFVGRQRGAELTASARLAANCARDTEFEEFVMRLSFRFQDCTGRMPSLKSNAAK